MNNTSHCPRCGTPVAAAFCTGCGLAKGGPPAGHSPTWAADPNQAPSTPTDAWPHDGYTSHDQPGSFRTGAYETTHSGYSGHSDQTGQTGATPPPATRTGRTPLITGLIAFITVIALGIAAVFGVNWWRDRPVNQALGSAHKAMSGVLTQLSNASSLDDLSAAGEAAPKAAAEVSKAASTLDGDDSRTAAARDVLQSQVALLEAIAPMEGLTNDSLTVWGTTLPEVESAQATLATKRRALIALDSGAKDTVADPSDATQHAAEVVAKAASTSLSAELESLLGELAGVKTTREAAALGERADPLGQTARAAATGQQRDAASKLDSLSTAFDAIAGLKEMDPENLQAWDQARPPLQEAAEALSINATAALSSMDAWVAQGSRTMQVWRTKYDAAQAQRSAATRGLDTYAADVRRVLRDYNRARDATADALRQAELDDYSAPWDVELAMEEGVTTRQNLLDELQFATVPSGMGDAHQRLTGVLQSAVDAMTTGEQAVEDWNACYEDCTDTYRDMAGWKEFSRASSGITQDFDASRRAWDSALTSALANANAVALPPMPRI